METIHLTEQLPTQEQLQEIAEKNKTPYAQAQPFPHTYFDNLLPDSILDAVLEEFPGEGSPAWDRVYKTHYEIKRGSGVEKEWGPATRQLMHYLNSQIFIDFLQTLTGIENLIPDPWYEGGGLHEIKPGGMLKVHADFNKHGKTGLHRRLNVLIYLNKDWKEEYRGHLELYDTDMKHCAQRILPVFNRMAMFSTTSESYHGHPDPLTCPEDRSRRSLALYYYTNTTPDDSSSRSDGHSTLWKLREGQDEAPPEQVAPPQSGLKRFVKAVTPPFIVNLFRKN